MATPALIYYVEDDEHIRDLTSYALRHAGFEVRAFPDGSGFIEACREKAPAAALLDIMLPGIDGFEVCRRIRATNSRIGIIMLTARSQEMDKVTGLMTGADDYVTKPYRPAVLLAHIQALLRRSAGPAADMTMRHKGVTLNIGAGTVSFGDRTAELTRNELRILQTLMRNPGVVVPRSEIMCALWESDAFIDDNTLTVNVNRLRKTLASLGVPDDFLVTRRGVGYAV